MVVAVAAGAFVAGRASDGREAGRVETGSVDAGFVRDMIDHHEQAVLLSSIVLRSEPSAPVRDIAVDVIASQRYEIGVLDGWLREWDLDRGAVTRRDAMAWMGHGTTLENMPGMAARDELAALTAARGTEADALFFELMSEHHEGGVHMAREAAERAESANVRWIAGLMSRNQQREIREMESVRLAMTSGR